MTRPKHDVVVVGAGLFGAMAARLAYDEGHRVTVVDDGRPFRASPCSGCVIAPSWLTALDKKQIVEGRAILDMFYGLERLDFRANMGVTFAAERVRTADVLALPEAVRRVKGEVLSVGSGHVNVKLISNSPTPIFETMRGKVLVAAGLWCSELLSDLPVIRGLYGASLLVSGQLVQPSLTVYAPYRQAVAFNMNAKQVWFGDGTALIEKTWLKEGDTRVVDTIERMKKYAGVRVSLKDSIRPNVGARPYIDTHKGGYYRKINNALYVSTGGAKNGTLLAALQAQQFVTDLRSAR